MKTFIIYAIAFCAVALVLGGMTGIVYFILHTIDKKRRRILSEAVHKLGGRTEGKKFFLFQKGRTLELIHKSHGEDSHETLFVSIPCPFPGDFTIMKNVSEDPDAVTMPLIGTMIKAFKGQKLPTGDPEFDRKFDVCGSMTKCPFVETYFSREERKNAIEEIFKAGAAEIQIRDQAIFASWFPFSLKKDINPKSIKAVLAPLVVLTEDIPQVPDEVLELSPETKKKLGIGCLPIILLFIGFISYFWGTWTYQPLSPGDLYQAALRYIYIALGLYSFIYIMIVFKPFSPGETGSDGILIKTGYSHLRSVPSEPKTQSSQSILLGKTFFALRIVFAAILIYVSFTYAGRNLAVLLNGMLDKGEQTEHTIEDLYKFQNKKNLSYIRFPSWRNPGTKEELHISSSEYKAIVPGKTKMIISTKPGTFGFEWIVSKKIEPNNE